MGTSVYWKNCMENTTFDLPNVNTEHLVHPYTFEAVDQDYLKGLVSSDLLFARKFPHAARVTRVGEREMLERTVGDVLPELWSQVRFQPGRTTPLARLQAGKGKNS